ncbi:hypothetical protein VTJ83DRAFT_854 [Remersonia thermophila]|uniref:ADF-H domain-containing protein n=1 Tax=Remersonia thermophila TaxID=72144 RepID=A0ABR4DMB7_9PEZI
MSLNGLDDPRIQEAYDAAAAEPGGWFLLKYASRDEVELLGRGSGGIVEIRENIAQYQDKSPLYGFLRYRRRSVIIKYLPEDCSRLIQARVTVHFNEVCDRFSPHDTTFAIADAKELKDSKLSAACSLHAASGSTSSSTSSIRRRRLMEIAEEEEEEERERKRQSVPQNDVRPGSSSLPVPEAPPVKLDAELAKLPDASRFANDSEPPTFTGVPRPASPTRSFDDSPRRMSSQSSRTDLYPPTSYTQYLKPRVKLAPRPSTDAGRPRSSGGSSANRVATVPAGLKSMSKGARKGRSQSQGQDDEAGAPSAKEQLEDTADAEVEFGHGGVDAPAPANGTAQAEPASEEPLLQASAPAPAQPPTKQNTMTPEKARLLKAMKLREKKKKLALQPTLDVPDTDLPSAFSTPVLPDENQESVPNTTEPAEATQDDLANAQADSGIDVGVDHASVTTIADSSQPASPLAGSEIGDSTQASSVSDSTEETVRAKEELEAGSEENQPASSKPAPTLAAEPASSERPAEETEAPAADRQSQITVTALGIQDDTSHSHNNGGEPSSSAPEEAGAEAPDVSASTHRAAALDQESGGKASTPPSQGSAAVVAASSTVDDGNDDKEPSQQLRIPVSKFSTQEPRVPTPTAATSLPVIVSPAPEVGSLHADETAPPAEERVAAESTAARKLPDPIKTDVGSDIDKRRSVISITDNDGFMDELQSATVQQATPVTVSKSPMSPLFAAEQAAQKTGGGGDSIAPAPLSARSASNPVRNSFLAPSDMAPLPARSASSGAAYLQKIAAQQQQSSELRPKSTKLGSSISQRIKALEKLSGNTSNPEPVPRERPASTFFAVRRVPTRDGSRPPSIVDQVSNADVSRPASRDSSADTTRSMGRGRSGSLANRLSAFEGGMPPRGKPESVQVTARIVRDPNHTFKGPEPKTTTDYPPLDLKQSQIVVDIQNRPPSSLSREIAIQAKQTLLERRLSRQSQESERNSTKTEPADGRGQSRSSLSTMKGYIKDRAESIIGSRSPSTDNLGNSGAANTSSSSRGSSNQQHGGSLARRLSISSRRSSIDQGRDGSVVDLDAEAKTDKKSPSGSGPASPKGASRATRFMRRLSNTLSPGRKNSSPSISPTVAEENAAEVEAASRASTATGVNASAPPAQQQQPTIIAFMGDVNVQFPDNLLWKRRSMCLDSQGFLILSSTQGRAMLHPPAPGKDRHGALVKRYHMSDFKPPFAPDVELQELPNSVVLDFISGSGLQVACEDRAGQMNVLRILEEAHRAYANHGH